MSEEITINYATAKKFILSTGQRASNDGVVELQSNINNYALKLVNAAKDISVSKNCKTILKEHIQSVTDIQ